jgi:putative thioredoxin
MAASGPSAASPYIKVGDTSSFRADVIEASVQGPVIVYFSAPWCGPCKALGPAMEKAVEGAKGKVKLVKVNVDENPQLAAGLRVQSIPAVFVFLRGQPVDGFMGALPDGQVKSFVEQCARMAANQAGQPGVPDITEFIKQAEELAAQGQHQQAVGLYQQILSLDDTSAPAYIGLIRSVLALGNIPAAKDLMANVPENVPTDKNWESVQKAVELAEKAASAPPSAGLKAKVEANPADHQARYDYAMSLYGEGQKEEGIDQLIEIMRRDRKWNEEAARKQLVSIFDALGFTDPLAIAGRRKMSSILFS